MFIHIIHTQHSSLKYATIFLTTVNKENISLSYLELNMDDLYLTGKLAFSCAAAYSVTVVVAAGRFQVINPGQAQPMAGQHFHIGPIPTQQWGMFRTVNCIDRWQHQFSYIIHVLKKMLDLRIQEFSNALSMS